VLTCERTQSYKPVENKSTRGGDHEDREKSETTKDKAPTPHSSTKPPHSLATFTTRRQAALGITHQVALTGFAECCAVSAGFDRFGPFFFEETLCQSSPGPRTDWLSYPFHGLIRLPYPNQSWYHRRPTSHSTIATARLNTDPYSFSLLPPSRSLAAYTYIHFPANHSALFPGASYDWPAGLKDGLNHACLDGANSDTD
jgi:hypothetical protein